MEWNVSLPFRPQSASINLETDGSDPKTRAINITTTLDVSCEIRTLDERSIRSAIWSIQLLERSIFNEQAKAEQAIGFLSYWPENNYSPEMCFASVAVDSIIFQTVYDTLKIGSLPDIINLSVKGMTYGDAPDGHLKIWDTKSASNLYVMGISINIPLFAIESKLSEDEIETSPLLATSVDANAIRQDITTAIMQMQNKISTRLGWLVSTGILALLAIYFK